MFKIEFAKSGV